MKYKTTATVALTSFAIFLALVVAGGICVAAGFPAYAKNSGVIDSVQDVISYVDDFDVSYTPAETEKASADYVRELGSDVRKVVLSTGGCSVDVRRGTEFSVAFSGNIAAGSAQADDKAVSSADAAEYYGSSGIIDADFRDGVLEIGVSTAKTINIVGFGVNTSFGHITVTFPDSYSGSFELNDSFAEVSFTGVDFDELVLDSCAGEAEIRSCNVSMLTISNLAGEVDVDGGNVAGVYFDNIAGEINVESLSGFTADSRISDVAGEVSIELPVGSQLNVTKSSVLGEVRIDRSISGDSGAANLEINSVLGEVHVGIND